MKTVAMHIRKISAFSDGLSAIGQLYRDHLIFTGAIVAALFAASYLIGQ